MDSYWGVKLLFTSSWRVVVVFGPDLLVKGPERFASSFFQICLQIAVIVFMGANGDKLDIFANKSIGQQIQVVVIWNLWTKTPFRSPFFSAPMVGFSMIFFISLSNASFSFFLNFFYPSSKGA